MAWGDKTITRKFIAYAAGYVDWMSVSEAVRPVPNTVAAKLSAPFFDKELFLQGGHWWFADPYITDFPNLNVSPQQLAPVDAYEADLAIAVAYQYLLSLALQFGTANDDLVPESSVARMLRSTDGRDDERKSAFVSVCQYLVRVASGVGHKRPQTRQLALNLLQLVEKTVDELEGHGSPAPEPAEQVEQDAIPDDDDAFWDSFDFDAFNADKTEDHDAGQVDDTGSAADLITQLETMNRKGFDPQPAAQLAEALGIEPDFGSQLFSSPLTSASDDGLRLGPLLVPFSVIINGDSASWYLLMTNAYLEDVGEDAEVHRWKLAPAGIDHNVLAERITAALRNLADRLENEERDAVLAALLAWGAVTDRAADAIWAANLFENYDEYGGFVFQSRVAAISALIDSPYTSREHVDELKRILDSDPLQ